MRKPKLEEMTLREKISQCLVGYQSAINRWVDEDFSIIRTEEEKTAVISREQFGTLWTQTGHADMFVNLYGRNVKSMQAFVEAVYGEIPFEGKSPVKLEPDRRAW